MKCFVVALFALVACVNASGVIPQQLTVSGLGYASPLGLGLASPYSLGASPLGLGAWGGAWGGPLARTVVGASPLGLGAWGGPLARTVVGASPLGLGAWGGPLARTVVGAPLALQAAPVVVAQEVAPAYVAATRGATHVAPLPGHTQSVSSLNVAPAPGTW